MTITPNIRINLLAPFPSLVYGTNGITVSKVNGFWQISGTSSGGGGGGGGTARTQRAFTSSGAITLTTADSIINLSLSGSATVSLPVYTTRAGLPFTFKDVSGVLSPSRTLTISTADSTNIDGHSTLVMFTAYQAVTVNPFTDGVNTGWFIT